MSTVRVLIAEDFEAFRRVARSILAKVPELQIIGEASNGLDAIQKAGELRPDLILLDVGLPQVNGIEAAWQIRKVAPECKILFVSQDSSADTVQAALDAGGQGYVWKSAAASELLVAVAAVLRGEQFVSRRVAG
jgi:DNA-binding NarL/FixJ family response regulator